MDLEGARKMAGQDGGRAVTAPTAERTSVVDLVFRFRYVLHLLAYAAGFSISWAGARSSRQQRVWLALPEVISRVSGVDLNRAIMGITICAVLLTTAAAILRTWEKAYLRAGGVGDTGLPGRTLLGAGPLRFMRHPLRLGTILHTMALCVLMSWAGAAVTLLSVVALQFVLIASEERSLHREMSASYAGYGQGAGQFDPNIINPGAASGAKVRWGTAIASEIYMWGAAATFAAFGGTYNAQPIFRGLLISLGLSIVVRGLLGKR